MSRRSLRLFIMILWVAGVAGVAGAEQATVLMVDPIDSPLVIRGKLDGQTTAFGGNVRLTALDGDATEVRLLSSELVCPADDCKINRSDVSIPPGIGLSKGQPRDIRVTVNNVTDPGEYGGKLKFLLPEQPYEKALEIALKLIIEPIEPKPNVQPVSSNVTFQLVRCKNSIDRFLAGVLLPQSALSKDWAIYLNNQTTEPVEVTDYNVVMRGEKTGRPVASDEIKIEKPFPLQAGEFKQIKMTIQRDQLSPDHYQGTVHFKVKGSDDPVTVNADFSLRNGPLWAVVVVLVGIVVGRLARGMSSPEAQKQVKLFPRFYELVASAERVKNTDAVTYLGRQVRNARDRIRSAKETEEVLSLMLDRLEGRINFLVALDELEDRLTGLGSDEVRRRLQTTIDEARRELIRERFDEAEKLRKEVEEELRKAEQGGKMTFKKFDIVFNLFRIKTAGWLASQGRQEPVPKWPRVAKIMTGLAGMEAAGAEVRYWLLRPLLFIILLVVLVLLGMYTLYVKEGSSFGAAALYDYLGLFLWGLSADVAQRTLQNVQMQK